MHIMSLQTYVFADSAPRSLLSTRRWVNRAARVVSCRPLELHVLPAEFPFPIMSQQAHCWLNRLYPFL